MIPASATSDMSLSCIFAMCPRIENMIKPANILVPLLAKAKIMLSLKRCKTNKVNKLLCYKTSINNYTK